MRTLLILVFVFSFIPAAGQRIIEHRGFILQMSKTLVGLDNSNIQFNNKFDDSPATIISKFENCLALDIQQIPSTSYEDCDIFLFKITLDTALVKSCELPFFPGKCPNDNYIIAYNFGGNDFYRLSGFRSLDIFQFILDLENCRNDKKESKKEFYNTLSIIDTDCLRTSMYRLSTGKLRKLKRGEFDCLSSCWDFSEVVIY
jgi:hypothetical protein